MRALEPARAAWRRARRTSRWLAAAAGTEVDLVRARRGGGADLAVFHEFVDAPWGGGNQFLRALVGELERRGLAVELNSISKGTRACLFNSFNFDFRRLGRFARADVRMVHRVDGPIGVYRGFDDGTDARIAAINAELADATIFQSEYSLARHLELGISLRRPVLVRNSVDPAIFFPPPERAPIKGRRIRVIATSWSRNPRKGADVFAWLDQHLDTARFEMTFVGQVDVELTRVRAVAPVSSIEVARLLRAHDVFLAASLDDPCSNALLEGLACGLPAVFRASGGHPELVGDAGVAFGKPEDVPEALDRLVREFDERRAAIRVIPISDVADRYLEVLNA